MISLRHDINHLFNGKQMAVGLFLSVYTAQQYSCSNTYNQIFIEYLIAVNVLFLKTALGSKKVQCTSQLSKVNLIVG